FLDRLWVNVSQMPALARLMRAEQHDLHMGDIPMFWTYPDSRELYTSQDECIPDFFEESSLANVRHKVQQLSEQDLLRQTWIIQASVLMAHLEVEQTGWRGSQLNAHAPRVETSDILRAACEVGDRLCTEAICTEEAVSWLTVHLVGTRSWSVLATSLDLYNGLAGICLFLAYLGDITRQDRYT